MRRVIAFTFAISVLATACSGGDDQSQPAPSADEAASTTPAAVPEPTTADATDSPDFIPIGSDPEFDAAGMPVPPDCASAEILLDTTIDGAAIIVREDPEGEFFCIEDDTAGPTPMPITLMAGPSAVDIPSFETMTTNGPRIIYQFRLPAGFASEFTVHADDGTLMPFARGRHIDYLLVIESLAAGATFDPSSFVARSLELLGTDGTTLALVQFSGIGEPRATYEDFAACVRQSGIDLPMPTTTNSSTPPPRVSAPQEAFEAAWEACKALFFDLFGPPQQQSPEYVEDFQFEQECLADAGFYPALSQEIPDQAAYELADGGCRLTSPGVTNLVACLGSNGLDVQVDGASVDGASKAGPWPIDVLGPAWIACRDAYALEDYGSPFVIAGEMPRANCFAENGWLLGLLWPRPFSDPTFAALNDQCRT